MRHVVPSDFKSSRSLDENSLANFKDYVQSTNTKDELKYTKLDARKIILVSGSISQSGPRPYAEIARKRLEEYAKLHGYGVYYFTEYIDKNYFVMWQKILAMKEALKDDKYDYAMWIDDDIYITNPNIKVEHFIDYTKSDIILSRDIIDTYNLYINSGTFIVKNSPLGKHYLEDILNSYDMFGGHFKTNLYHEQTIMTYKYFAKYLKSEKITVLNHRIMQSFFKDHIWNSNDFCIHFAGFNSEVRTRGMRILDKILQETKNQNYTTKFYDIIDPSL